MGARTEQIKRNDVSEEHATGPLGNGRSYGQVDSGGVAAEVEQVNSADTLRELGLGVMQHPAREEGTDVRIAAHNFGVACRGPRT